MFGEVWKGCIMKQLMDILKKYFPLEEQSAGEFANIKVKGMKFTIKKFYAKGLGNVSTMEAVGFFGLMKMDTLVINPVECDMPLFSYDRIHAMGNDTLILELYDTMLESCDMSGVKTVKANYAYLPEHDPGEHWYDNIKLKESISKKGKKKETPAYDKLEADYLDAFLNAAKSAKACDAAAKREKASVYVEGLLENGGPAATIFIENYGKEKTAWFFRKVLFGTQE